MTLEEVPSWVTGSAPTDPIHQQVRLPKCNSRYCMSPQYAHSTADQTVPTANAFAVSHTSNIAGQSFWLHEPLLQTPVTNG